MPTDTDERARLYNNDGYIVMLDVVGFSKLGNAAQIQVVERLWAFLSTHAVVLKEHALVNCTGDGVLIACPANPRSIREQDVIDLVRSCMDHMRTGPHGTRLRAGVHRGPFAELMLPGLTSPQAIGTGPNDCARICSIGDAGHIVVSDRFCMEWREHEPGVLALFKPREAPFEVPVKHGVQSKVRLYLGAGANGSAPAPERIAVLQLGEGQLRRLLVEIEEFFIALLNEKTTKRTKFSARRVQARVSIFGLEQGVQPMLRPTMFRYSQFSSQVPGPTNYCAVPPGEGPVGRAFVTGGVVCVPHLPDPHCEFAKYAKQLRKHNLTESQVRNFGVKARTFIAFPFGLSDEDFDGAVCIDTVAPLTEVRKRDLREIGQDLSDMFRLLLGSLYRLRA